MKFKKCGKTYLPLGTLEGRALNVALRKWIKTSFGPFLIYLGNEVRREFKLSPAMMSLNFGCSDGTIITCCTGEELLSRIQSKMKSEKDWPDPKSFGGIVEVFCISGHENSHWSEGIGISISPEGTHNSTPYWVAEIDDHVFSFEEQMSLLKAQEIVENVLLGLRIQVMAR